MIVDFVMDFVFGLGEWVVSILPSNVSIWNFGGAGYQGDDTWQGGTAFSEAMRVLAAANYFLPLVELLGLLGVIVAVYAAIMLYRFIWRLIPGMG